MVPQAHPATTSTRFQNHPTVTFPESGTIDALQEEITAGGINSVALSGTYTLVPQLSARHDADNSHTARIPCGVAPVALSLCTP